jgi:short-subunit dehydrogenase
MRSEFARDRIGVSTIMPGLMRTGSPRHARFKGDKEKEYAWFAISDSLPLITVSSARAARRIVRALEYGEAEVVIGAAAKLAAFARGIVPDRIADALTLANALLPTGSDPSERPGYESESALAPSVLTTLTEQAAVRNNEM